MHGTVYCDMVNGKFCAIQHFSLHVLHRNWQKAKKAIDEREKQYVEALGTLGHAVGEYVGGGPHVHGACVYTISVRG